MRGRGIPRTIEASLASAGLVVLAPLLALIALFVFLGSGHPVFFRQNRVGRYGQPFVLYKFRTMVSAGGPAVTARDDKRITRVGRILRRTKLDELPELWNVVRGDMSLVGPRPEAPRYVCDDEPRWQVVLEARPGLTDPVTLSLIDEESLLASVEGDREEYYMNVLLPKKLDGYVAYQNARTWRSDADVLLKTVRALFSRMAGQ